MSLPQSLPLTVADCRCLVKTLVCGMKTLTWGVGACKMSAGGAAGVAVGGSSGAPGAVDYTSKSTPGSHALELCACV